MPRASQGGERGRRVEKRPPLPAPGRDRHDGEPRHVEEASHVLQDERSCGRRCRSSSTATSCSTPRAGAGRCRGRDDRNSRRALSGVSPALRRARSDGAMRSMATCTSPSYARACVRGHRPCRPDAAGGPADRALLGCSMTISPTRCSPSAGDACFAMCRELPGGTRRPWRRSWRRSGGRKRGRRPAGRQPRARVPRALVPG